MPFGFNEATRVQMPAMVHLTRLGYKYFGKISEEQAGIVFDADTNILIDEFKKQFVKLNPEHEGSFEQVLKEIRQELDNKPSNKIPKRRDSLEKYNTTVEQYNRLISRIDFYLNQIQADEQLCQLSKYFIQSHIDAELSNRGNLPIYYYFLVPNYTANKFDINENGYIDGYAYSTNYKLIKYSDLYTIFENILNLPYRQDILNEFKMLSSEHDNFDQNRQIYSFLKKAGL